MQGDLAAEFVAFFRGLLVGVLVKFPCVVFGAFVADMVDDG